MARPIHTSADSIRSVDKQSIAEASALIGAGKCVAVPTETVYGLAADATNKTAVARIFEIKGRPSFNPLIVHVTSVEAARKIALFDEAAEKLAQAFWPGALTLVLPLRGDSRIASLATAGLGTIAIRVPAHPAMRDLLMACGKPLAAPSANSSGRISPTRARHVAQDLGSKVGLILDAGPTTLGLESTIISAHSGEVSLLRPGPVSADAVSRIVGPLAGPKQNQPINAPGQLESHYAPSKALRLNATARESGEWLIGFGQADGDSNLSPSGDLVEAAATLFDLLHEADAASAASIAVAPVPAEGIGVAINDRLARAAA